MLFGFQNRFEYEFCLRSALPSLLPVLSIYVWPQAGKYGGSWEKSYSLYEGSAANYKLNSDSFQEW